MTEYFTLLFQISLALILVPAMSAFMLVAFWHVITLVFFVLIVLSEACGIKKTNSVDNRQEKL